jgi:arylsulfatase A-like enzyme
MGTPLDVVNDSIMFSLDRLPTMCSLAGCDIPWEIVEGEDMSDVWMGAVQNCQTPLFYQGIGSHPSYRETHWIRYGPWKLVKHNEELYHLDADPDERDNIYQNYPDIVLALSDAIQAWDSTLPTDHVRFPDEAA